MDAERWQEIEGRLAAVERVAEVRLERIEVLRQRLMVAEALLESFGDLLCEGHLQAGDDHIAYAPTGDWCPFDGITTWMLKQTGLFLAARIRAWRDGDGDGREEQEGESDNRD